MAIISPSCFFGATFKQIANPINPKEGDVWFNPSNDKYQIYQTNQWVQMFNKNVGPGPGADYGFIGGGQNHSEVQRFLFPFDSGVAVVSGSLTKTETYDLSACNSREYGYINLGENTTTIDRIEFPFDSGTSIRVGNTALVRFTAAGFDGTDFSSIFV